MNVGETLGPVHHDSTLQHPFTSLVCLQVSGGARETEALREEAGGGRGRNETGERSCAVCCESVYLSSVFTQTQMYRPTFIHTEIHRIGLMSRINIGIGINKICLSAFIVIIVGVWNKPPCTFMSGYRLVSTLG